MFPSTGHFKSLHCPFYLEKECDRIYCHFRHVKNSNEKSRENAIILNLEKQICKNLNIDKETFDILADEEDENIHEKLLNRRLKNMFPNCENIIDEFRFPESSFKDNIEFTLTNSVTDENVNNLINLTEQDDDTPLDEGPLKQFLEEDAKRNSNSKEKNRNTLEKRHIIISCLEKIDKKEFSPRRIGIIQPRKFQNIDEKCNVVNDIESVNMNDIITQPVETHNQIKIKQEIYPSDSSESDDNAEIDSVLTQIELLNPQLFKYEKTKEFRREPPDLSYNKNTELKLNLEPHETLPTKNSFDISENNSFSSSSVHSLPQCTGNRYGRLNTKSVQAINNEVGTSSSLFDIKYEKTPEYECTNSNTSITSNILTAATIAEQNRLKNVFKNTICTNIDQFFDLCDACKVYGTEIFNLLEPLLNYLIERLNPEFNYEKLRQLHSQNVSLSCSLPFITSCDHMRNCIECHNLLLCSLSKSKVKKIDEETETFTSQFQISQHDTPLSKIEAGLHDITKEIISLGIPMENNSMIINDEHLTQRIVDVKHVECQTEIRPQSHSKRESSRAHRHSITKKRSNHDNEEYESKEKKSFCVGNKKKKFKESKRIIEKRLKQSYSENRSSKSSSSHKYKKKRKEDSENDDDTSEDEHKKNSKRRCSSSIRETEIKKCSSEKHNSELKKPKVENSILKCSYDDKKKTKLVETIVIDDSPEKVKNNFVNSDGDHIENTFNSRSSSTSLDSDTGSDSAYLNNDTNKTDSENEEEKQNSKKSDNSLIQYPSVSLKKRVSHVNESNSSTIQRKEVIKKNIPTPAEVLFQRIQQSKKLEENSVDPISSSVINANDRIRISHVPNVALLLKAKERLQNDLLQKAKLPIPIKTVAQTIPKGHNRVAHTPTDTSTSKLKDVSVLSNNKCPIINSYKATNNIPLPMRQNGLNRLYNIFAKKVPANLASELALKEEKNIHEKVTITKVYLNSLAMAIHRITKEDPAKLIEKNSEYPNELNGFSTYDLLNKHILTYEQLEINGFPLAIPDQPGCCRISTKAVHYKPIINKKNGDRFYCLQCKDLFEIDPETGLPVTPSPGCRFHQLRPRKEPGRTRHDVFYPCCNKSISESGCVTVDFHTPDMTDDDCLEGFLETREASPGEQGLKKFYALDCEMCYTTVGPELTRVTVIGHDCNTVYDSLVKPRNRILDYCTKFSGITKEKLRNVTKTLEQVRQELFQFIFKDTILIGHSLENDLKALKILHHNIVDTSVMYPHRDAPERKFALKYLASSVIHFLIQENEYGHDSKEDALACMKLVWKKIKEDSKIHRPRKIIGSPERSK